MRPRLSIILLPRRELKSINATYSPLDNYVMALRFRRMISAAVAKKIHDRIAQEWEKEIRRAIRKHRKEKG